MVARPGISPGVHVVSGPIDLTAVSSSFSLDSPQGSGILVPSDDDFTLSDPPSSLQTFYTTVVIRSNQNKVSVSCNANLGSVRQQTSEDQ